jgi:hypothetical protein
VRTQTTRVISGSIGSQGQPISGTSEWTSRRFATGDFYVTVAPGLRLLGASAASASGNAIYTSVAVNNPAPGTFRVLMFNSSAAPIDQAVVFTAVVAA